MDKEQAKKRIIDFVTSRGYTYTVEKLLGTYVEYYKKGWYISYTAKDCIKHLENELETLVE